MGSRRSPSEAGAAHDRADARPRRPAPTSPPGWRSENVFVSVRGESVRVSPHLYNTEGDVERLFEVLEQVTG